MLFTSCGVMGTQSQSSSAASQQQSVSSAQSSGGVSSSQSTTAAWQNNDDIAKEVNEMTTDEKVGQLIISGFDGYTVDSSLKDLIENYHIGGTILFSPNVKSAQQVVDLNNEIKKTNGDNIPLFVTMDEEGGEVSRLPNEITELPSAYSIASTNNKGLVYKCAKQLGTQISALGFCTGNSPVLDIWSNPNNTVIGDRAYGTDTQSVLTYAITAMNGIRDGGAIPVGKHFPGHGDTDIDSHYGLPIVTKSVSELQQMEFAPFKEAIKEGIPAIMVTHILLDSVDSVYPSSMSDKVVNGILRNDLGFKGVCFSDDMTMGAITENFTIEKASVMSINAGVDCLLICHEYSNTINVIAAVKAAVSDGTITKDRLNEAVTRILQLKHDYSVTNDQTLMPDIVSLNTATNSLISQIGA